MYCIYLQLAQPHMWVPHMRRSSLYPLCHSLWLQHPNQTPVHNIAFTKHLSHKDQDYFIKSCIILSHFWQYAITHLSPFDRISQEADDIFSFTVCGFKALCPSYQISLYSSKHDKSSGFHSIDEQMKLKKQTRQLTASRLVCLHGKEKVKPRGRRAFFIPI